MKQILIGMIFFPLLLYSLQLAGQMYEPNSCTCKGNPGLKTKIAKGVVDSLFDDSVNNGSFEQWSTSQLKAEGKGPKVLSEEDDPVGNSAAAYDEWSCQYSAFSAMDNNSKTAWAEGKADDGIGEIVLVKADLSKPVRIWAGVGVSQKLFNENNRPKNIRVHLLFTDQTSAAQTGMAYVGIKTVAKREAELKDLNGYQPLPLPQFTLKEGNYFIAVEILSVYSGTKYKDTCITEIGN